MKENGSKNTTTTNAWNGETDIHPDWMKAVSNKPIPNVPHGGVDMINSPPHYKTGTIECIDAMEAMVNQSREMKVKLDGHSFYNWQTIFKYIWRFPFKDLPIQDLKKARYYLDRLISTLEKSDMVNK